MPESFLSRFAKDERLGEKDVEILSTVNVRSVEDVDSLIRGFPSVSRFGVHLAKLSNATSQHLSSAYSNASASVTSQPMHVAFGALPPPGSPVTIGSIVGSPVPPLPPSGSGTGQGGGKGPKGPIDLRLPHWPVRNQFDRGTCVAFGAVACLEHLAHHQAQGPQDWSEQFLYWSIKSLSADPNKGSDGTWLLYAHPMVEEHGVCDESTWPYVGTIVHPVSGATATAPSAVAVSTATTRCRKASTYIRRPSDAAETILKLLRDKRPVAITLPLFRDPQLTSGPTNWTTPVGKMYGRVLNPPPSSMVIGGHCVCVTGFAPDASEPNGGYFIFRNSWGTGWAHAAPTQGATLSPEPGYGEISASYVDSYCWELLQY